MEKELAPIGEKPSSAEATEGKKERPQHEVELEQEPLSKEGESYDKWLQRIGGPNVLLVKNAKEIAEVFKPLPRKKVDK
ncbi:unnamed protein product, partial [marine sediment metagenome]